MLGSANKMLDSVQTDELIGIVVANNDPSKLHRLQVRIPGIYDGLQDQDIPWAKPTKGAIIGQGGGAFVFGVPVVGSHVYIRLQDGDPNQPEYYACPILGPDTNDPIASASYPNRYGVKDPKGNWFFVDMATGVIQLNHFTGTSATINNDGSVLVNVVATTTVNSTGDITMTSKGNINLNAVSINLTASSGVVEKSSSHTIATGSLSMGGTSGGDTTGTLTGDFVMSGTLDASGAVIDRGTILHTHTHTAQGSNAVTSGPN